MKNKQKMQDSPEAATKSASLCATDLPLLLASRSIMGALGHASSAISLAWVYVDGNSRELVLTDRGGGSPGGLFETRIPCQPGGGSAWCAPAPQFFQELLRNPPPQVPYLHLEVSGGDVCVEAPGGSWKISCPRQPIPSRSAPTPGSEVQVPTALLLRLVESAAVSVSQDLTRAHLAQILLDVGEGQVCSVSTDGHRLTHTSTDIELPPQIRGQFFIPSTLLKALLQLLRSGADAWVGRCSGKDWSVRVGPHRLVINPADASYPPYQQVIPRSDRPGPRVLLETKQLIKALGHFESAHKILKDAKAPGIQLVISADQFRLRASALSSQEIALVPADVFGDVPQTPIEVGIGLRYLVAAVRQVGGDMVWVEFSDPLDPVVVRPAAAGSFVSGMNTFSVIMPMRL